MFKGFYNLTSGVLTHQRNLDVIANNMTNISTPGFKQDRYTATTFDEVLYSRVGNKDGKGNPIGNQSYIRATSDVITDFSQSGFEPTGYPLDFAISGEGFFAVQNGEGQVAYTRAGNFTLDDEGDLCLAGIGKVLSANGQPLKVGTDKIHANADGSIFTDDSRLLGKLGVYVFADNAALERNDQGLFVGDNAQISAEAKVLNGYVERSNTDVVKQMTEMITFQRSLQSAAQVMKMYDSLMTKAANEVGRL